MDGDDDGVPLDEDCDGVLLGVDGSEFPFVNGDCSLLNKDVNDSNLDLVGDGVGDDFPLDGEGVDFSFAGEGDKLPLDGEGKGFPLNGDDDFRSSILKQKFFFHKNYDNKKQGKCCTKLQIKTFLG